MHGHLPRDPRTLAWRAGDDERRSHGELGMTGPGWVCVLLFFLNILSNHAFAEKRLADFGVDIGAYERGKLNAITDVKGVMVGHVTLIEGNGDLEVGIGPIRTGVTVILPTGHEDIWQNKVTAGSFVLNGNGEAAGLMWIQESGILETPIALTNTLSVGSVQKGLVDYMLSTHPDIGISDDTLTPVVMECDDSSLNDIRGQHVKPEHVAQAIKNAKSGAVAEGGVGAGTGMISYEFKGGIGTSSRVLRAGAGGYTIGVMLNANHGARETLRFKNILLGEMIPDLKPTKTQDGSVVVVFATDAPLDGRQLSRVAKRVMLGIARTGAMGYHGSGDIVVGFSTGNRIPHYPDKPVLNLRILSDFWLDEIFEAATDAAEEAMLNALLAGKTMVGRDGNTVYGLPHDRLEEILRQHPHIKVKYHEK